MKKYNVIINFHLLQKNGHPTIAAFEYPLERFAVKNHFNLVLNTSLYVGILSG